MITRRFYNNLLSFKTSNVLACLLNKRNGMWFTRKHKCRPKILPLAELPRQPDDVENEEPEFTIEKIGDWPLDEVKDLEEYKNAPENIKKMYTYKFMPQRQQFCHLIRRTMDNLDPKVTRNVMSREMAQLTITLRLLKKMYKDEPLRKDFKRYIISYSQARKDLMYYIRQINIDDYNYLVEKFNLVIKPIPNDPVFVVCERVEEQERKCEEKRQLKMKALEEDLHEEWKQFVVEKRKKLAEIESMLSGIGLSLEEVLKEVIEQRRADAIQPIFDESFAWRAEEEAAKIEVEKKRLRREEEMKKLQRN